MVRMLGFSEEDKQRIGIAQHAAGKGVVRGVLGLPGRLVGGIMRGSSPESSSHVASDNQSFTDLWVDFLLKETEERDKRELSELSRLSSPQDEHIKLCNAIICSRKCNKIPEWDKCFWFAQWTIPTEPVFIYASFKNNPENGPFGC